LSTQESQLPAIRIEGEETQSDGLFVIEGNLFETLGGTVSHWGTSSKEPEAYAAGDTADLGDGRSLMPS
jgi:alpha-glucoside transport system permease protein